MQERSKNLALNNQDYLMGLMVIWDHQDVHYLEHKQNTSAHDS